MTQISPRTSEHLGVILVSGPDARSFLQGQLTADLDTLSQHNVLLAACNSPQGRVQSILWLLERSEGIAMLVERALVETTLARLRRYVLRAKVTFDPSHFNVGLLSRDEAPPIGGTRSDRSHTEVDAASFLTLPGHHHLMVVAPSHTMLTANPAENLAWHLDHLRAGLPQIRPETHERFVAQMLNLDLLGGISFEKGCYTGQEIIARTHFRGAIKRRMFRYSAACGAPAAGTRLVLDGQHAGDIVDAVQTAEGCELLAVVNLVNADANLRLEMDDGVALYKLELPYPV